MKWPDGWAKGEGSHKSADHYRTEGPTEPVPHGVYLQDPDVTLYHGDVLEQLAGLPDESVHCVVTSPPYWGLRDYGTGSWEGGDADCDHVAPPKGGPHTASTLGPKRDGLGPDNAAWADSKRNHQFRDVCGKCGAQRTDQQLGLEPTPDLYIERMVMVFREVRRVLRKDGTCWLNIGDSYAGGNQGGTTRDKELPNPPAGWTNRIQRTDLDMKAAGLKPKDLVGIPWKLAFALQADGWWLRADIIWSKPNPMPESVTDRPTKAHEYVFLLTKSPRYFYDQEAVREPHNDKAGPVTRFGNTGANGGYQGGAVSDDPAVRPDLPKAPGGRVYHPAGRNVRSVWTIATEPYPDAHFATFPTELARRCILAGTSERGCCPECGAPWVREVEIIRPDDYDPSIGAADPKFRQAMAHRNTTANHQPRANNRPITKIFADSLGSSRETVGWCPSCDCHSREPSKDETCYCPKCGSEGPFASRCYCDPARKRPYFRVPRPQPCTVLDPFVGSGTVPYVARLHNRHAIGIDLNADYLQLAARRLQQQSLFAVTQP